MIHNRLRFVLFAIPVVAMAALTIAAYRLHPAGGGVIDPTCTSSLPCIEYDNNSTGPGIRGISVSGNGLAGATKNAGTTAANGRAGLIGNDIGSGTFNSGVYGLSVSGTGVFGQSTNGFGVYGISTNRGGVYGSTAFASTSVSNGTAGVRGVDISSVGSWNSGVKGSSANGFGVQGSSTNGTGVKGITSGLDIAAIDGTSLRNGIGVSGTSGDLGGFFYSTGASGSGAGVVGEAQTGVVGIETFDGGSAIQAQTHRGVGVEVFSGAQVGDPAGIDVTVTAGGQIMAARGNSGVDIFTIDNSGNVHAHSFTANLLARSGRKVVTYAPQASEPIIEDFGEVQLVNGSAYVNIDSSFASSMADGANYLVFITPEGDNHGLYVTQKSPRGFAVHESQSGHSTLAFSYRIVAKPFGNQAPRLPLLVEHRVPLPKSYIPRPPVINDKRTFPRIPR